MKMITKTQIIDSLNNLPENLTIDQVIDHLVVVEKIQKGLKDSASGRVYDKEQAKKKLKKWLK
jgi:predicted transcriptional regulator